MTLVLKPVPASTGIKDYPPMIYSPPGVGKSCFVASLAHCIGIEKVYYMDTDPQMGLRAHELLRSHVTSFSEAVALANDVAASRSIEWVVVDGMGGLYDLAFSHVCKKNGVRHPSEKGEFGQMMWAIIVQDVMSVIHTLQRSGKGVLATAHAMSSESLFKGKKINVWTPAFTGGKPMSMFAQATNAFPLIGFLHLESLYAVPTKATNIQIVDMRADMSEAVEVGEGRVIEFVASQYFYAKDRSRRLNKPIKLPQDYTQDWKTLMDAWEGKEESEE